MAARYPEQWLETLRERADIASVVSEYVPLKPKGRSLWGLCPFHGEKTPSFKVDPDQGLYYCFGCKAGGSVFQFVMEIERMEFSEAVRYLADKVRLPLPEMENDREAEKFRTQRERIQELNRRAAHIFHETLYTSAARPVLEYLHGRGLDDPSIRMFGLGAAPEGWDVLTQRLIGEGATPQELTLAGLSVEKGEKRFDMFRNRAIFPIINAHGTVLGFGGRAMGDAQPKYLNTSDTPAFNKRQNVYAANLLKKTRGLARVLLVEGYMDVVSLVRHGVTGVCATLGTSLTQEQAKLMKRYAPEIWIAYDGDAAGQNATLRALDILQGMDIPARVLVIPGGQDPDDFIRAQGREAFEAIKPLSAPLYRMERAAEGLDLAQEEGRTQYAIAAAKILKQVRQPVELENLLKRLMVSTGFSREVLIQQIGIAGVDKPVRPTAPSRPKQETRAPDSRRQGDAYIAERKLLTLMAAGLVPRGMVTAGQFADDVHRTIAEGLLGGRKSAELVDGCEDAADRAVMVEVFGEEPLIEEEEALRVITECVERMRRGWIDDRIEALMAQVEAASQDGKRDALMEVMQLRKEKERLRPGRKE